MHLELLLKALPLIIERLKTVQVDCSHHVPFTGGQSKTENKVYIDSRIPNKIKLKGSVYNTVKYLTLHEVIEKAIEDIAPIGYDSAHDMAEVAMIDFIKDDNLDPKPFNEYISKIYPWTLKHFDPNMVPKDLFLKPYKDDHKNEVLQSLKPT